MKVKWIVLFLLFVLVRPGMTWQDQPQTQGLSHLGLTVSDLDATADFFVDYLGWRVAGNRPEYPARFVTDGQIFLTLWRATDPDNVVKFDRKNNIGLHHLALKIDSFDKLDELYQKIKDAPGVVIEFAPELMNGGPSKHMMIREPSGNRIELVHRPSR